MSASDHVNVDDRVSADNHAGMTASVTVGVEVTVEIVEVEVTVKVKEVEAAVEVVGVEAVALIEAQIAVIANIATAAIGDHAPPPHHAHIKTIIINIKITIIINI